MTRYVNVSFWVIMFVLVTLPCCAWAASITEKRANIGYECVVTKDYSTAMGKETTASGFYSTAMGYNTTASGYNSTAMGFNTTASGYNSTAMGIDTVASNHYSTAMGYGANASGVSSTAMGSGTTAAGDCSTAMGWANSASGDVSFAAGQMMELTDAADGTFVWGYANRIQSISAAKSFLIFPAGTAGKVGIGTKSPQNLVDLGETKGKKLAVFQKTTGDDFYGFGISSNTLEVYAGVTSEETNPAVVVKKTTGNVGIGTSLPNYLFEVDGSAGKPGGGSWTNSSDERLKDIMGEYNPGLDEIASLNPVVFYYKVDNPRGLPSENEYVGFIAQEVQVVFPEAVSEGPDGYLDFNMHPVNVALVNAVKELKVENDALKVKNASLEKEISKIKEILGI